MKILKSFRHLFCASLILAAPLAANAEGFKYSRERTYEITVTNVTKGQTFTPIVATSHNRGIALFELGAPAIPELATIAESGNIAPLAELLATVPQVAGNNAATDGLLAPGGSVTFELTTTRRYPLLSLAAMLIPTNDTFVAIDSVKFPFYGTKKVFARAYDAGSEVNDELCANIPGPACGGTGPSEEDGEGFVHIANGVSGDGDLAVSTYNWDGAVALVEITRIK